MCQAMNPWATELKKAATNNDLRRAANELAAVLNDEDISIERKARWVRAALHVWAASAENEALEGVSATLLEEQGNLMRPKLLDALQWIDAQDVSQTLPTHRKTSGDSSSLTGTMGDERPSP